MDKRLLAVGGIILLAVGVVIGYQYMYWFDWPCVPCPTPVPTQTVMPTYTRYPTGTSAPTATARPTYTLWPTLTRTLSPTPSPTPEECRPCEPGVTDCWPYFYCDFCFGGPGWICVDKDEPTAYCEYCKGQAPPPTGTPNPTNVPAPTNTSGGPTSTPRAPTSTPEIPGFIEPSPTCTQFCEPCPTSTGIVCDSCTVGKNQCDIGWHCRYCYGVGWKCVPDTSPNAYCQACKG